MNINGMERFEVRESSSIHWERLKQVGKFIGGTIAALVIAVAHPILGPLGAIACLFGAAYHGILLNYHWKHTRAEDRNKKLIPGTDIASACRGIESYQSKDLPRLEHELQRLNSLEELKSSLKWARGFAKGTLPIIGPVWAFFSEIQQDGSVPVFDDGGYTKRYRSLVEARIGQLKQEQSAPARNEILTH